ncbi:hypothetical protein ACSV9I_14515 [Rhizobium sp. G187]|uniref:hypothetical protein n=1 Tax=Rhizobium sp. G187 TaxID=3451352 RepID=UPI003EE7AA30
MKIFSSLLLAIMFVAAPSLAAADDIPPPVHGVSFEAWAEASARLANNQDRKQVLQSLAVDDQMFEEVNERFLEALREDKDLKLTSRYGEAFSRADAALFAETTGSIARERKLVTFDDYARVQGHLEAAASSPGFDPQAVLAEHGLTVYEFSEDAGYWVQKLREQALAGDGAAIRNWNETLARRKAEYSARYPAP